MRKRFKNPLYLISLLIVLLIALGVFYVIYKNMKDEAVIKTTGPLSVNYFNGNKIRISKNKTVEFSVINSSNEDAYYFIEFKNLKNIKDNIKYTLTDNKDINVSDNLNSYNTVVSSYIKISGEETQNYILTFESEDSIAYSLELNVALENLETNNFAEVILKNNEVKDNPKTVPGKDIATEDEGLIKSTDDYGTTYYFRGNVKNNNVRIDGLNYKIVRINGDGSVRLVLDGVADTLKKYYDNVNDYSYKSSIVNTYLTNEWLNKNITDSSFYIANQKYCNDISNNENGFLALTRLKTDNIPSFVCLGEKISSKIGILTADEVIFAGATLNENNTSFYLYNKDISTNYYLSTASSLSNNAYYPFMVNPSGKLINNDSGMYLRAVRPVITIIKTAMVDGDGSVNNPYILL